MFRSDSFRGKLYEGNQILELTKGLQRGLDASAYADPGFRTSQMHKIRKGLDVSLYAKKEFDAAKMEQIMLGLSEGVDASIYANKY